VLTQERLDRIVQGAATKRHIHGFLMQVRRDGRALTSAAGNLSPSSRFFAASVTKLFVTAVLLKLEAAGTLTLHDPIGLHLPAEIVDGLHVMNGIDRSRSIEIMQLMSNTSGIPDYFDRATVGRLVANHDDVWGLQPALASAKQKTPRFVPGKRAQYSDTNYQLLGAIIESAADTSLDAVLRDLVFLPLDLADTYLYRGEPDDRLAPLYFKDRRLELPRYMASIGAEGGIVATATDLADFVDAFFGGALFDVAQLQRLYAWRLLLSPGVFYYGAGISRQPVSLFHLRGGLYGHWGQSGAFAFFEPVSGTTLTGTANQFVGQRVAARAMVKVLRHTGAAVK
jgi:D-alanyl-D-alanine carboxypeptidase